MSWDKFDRTYTSPCACGGGTVIMTERWASDDWNRMRFDGRSFVIGCESCKQKYHISTITRRYFELPWKGDGVSTKFYLVPDDIEMPSVRTPKVFFYWPSHKEEIAALFPLAILIATIEDMRKAKYSTRLQRAESKEIVKIYHHRTGKRNLPDLILCLEEVISNYDSYQWNCEKIKAHQNREEAEIAENEKQIAAAVKISYELDFKRNP